eukprot:GDKJ01063517.1.p1 GENE.GDKJ01063517.1~~GDKJ01063517.1.p1  ORF type:complete len:659 (-),score=156.45 GDKJ01063517.1:54-2030(-)
MSDIAKEIKTSSMELVKLSNALPRGEAFTTQMLDKDIKERITIVNAAVNNLLSKLASLSSDNEVKRTKAGGITGLLGDIIDTICDNIDDIISPKKRQESTSVHALSKSNKILSSGVGIQNNWQPPNYNNFCHFVPENFQKIHAKVPLSGDWIKALKSVDSYRMNEKADHLPNPYEVEILNLDFRAEMSGDKHGAKLFNVSIPIPPNPIRSTNLDYIDNEEALMKMVSEVRDQMGEGGVVAIDVEHHSIKSFKGFTCLIQLSTRSNDYLIDPFNMFHCLGKHFNQITTDPKILKVFHGSDHDIMWLQRDFGVYIVGMFDTFRAAQRLLVTSGFSLANLLKIYCGVELNKEQQTSDWSVRPLSEEQLEYARQDTHSLIYLYDCMKNHLLVLPENAGAKTAANCKAEACVGEGEVTQYGMTCLLDVLRDSGTCAARAYEDGRLNVVEAAENFILKKAGVHAYMAEKNRGVLEAILAWRDKEAREKDVSPSSILSDVVIAKLTAAPPRSFSALNKELENKRGGARINTSTLLEVILEALERGAGISIAAVKRQSEVGDDENVSPSAKRRRSEQISSKIEQKNESFVREQARRQSSSVVLMKNNETRRQNILELESDEKAAEVAFLERRDQIHQARQSDAKRMLRQKAVAKTAILRSLLGNSE